MRLRNKTLLFIMPLLIVPIAIIGMASLYKISDLSRQELNVRADTFLNQISTNHSDRVKTAEASLLLLADHRLVMQYALTDDPAVKYELLLPHLLEVFENFQNSAPQYYEIKFITVDGYEDAIWTSKEIINKSESVAGERYFPELLETNKKIFKKLIFDKNTGEYAILLVHKIALASPAADAVYAEPKLRGFLAISLRLDVLRKHVMDNQLGSQSFLGVVNHEGQNIFVRNEFKAISEQIVKRQGGVFFDNLKQSVVTIGDQVFTIDKRLLSGDMLLMSALSSVDIDEHGRELGEIITLITLVALCSGVVLTFVAIRKIVINPLGALSKAAVSIGEGKHMPAINTNSNDEIQELAVTLSTMSKNLMQMHNEVSYTANHDGLTGLPNRTMFISYLSDMISIAGQKQHKIALLFIDLDDFKGVNDTLGHHVGDGLLNGISNRLSETIRTSPSGSSPKAPKAADLVARLAGDEFVILLNDVEGPWEAAAVADRVIKSMLLPFDVEGIQLYASCSIGIALYPDDASSYNDLIQTSDIAMYHAKQQGKNHYQFYAERLNTDLHQRLKINSRLRQSLQDENFYINYQPKVDSSTGRMTGMEALIRWNDTELGSVPPGVFIPIAEESGFITPLTEWLIANVCKQIRRWQTEGLSPPPVALNISSIQFKRRDLFKILSSALLENGIASHQVEVELTETSLLTNIDEAIDILEELSNLGIKVSLDDFGTGYSSLNYLNKLPIHALKIDKSFIIDITSEDEEHAIVDAILALARALDLQVVAEGVETQTQLHFLKQRKCNVLQGFYLGRPVAESEISKLFEHQFFDVST